MLDPRRLRTVSDGIARGRTFPALRRRLPRATSTRCIRPAPRSTACHVHDDLLEDLSRTAIDDARRRAGRLRPPPRRHSRRRPDRRSSRSSTGSSAPTSRRGSSSSKSVRTWERNPHFYAEHAGSSLAAQALFTYAPETERARRVLSKLRQVPRLVQAARDNIKDPPASSSRSASRRCAARHVHRRRPAARVRRRRRPAPARRPRRRVDRGGAGDRRLRRQSRDRGAPQGQGARSASGASSSSRSSTSTRASRCRAIGCCAIAIASWPRRRKSSARWPAGSTAAIRSRPGARPRSSHPAPGELVATAREQLDELADVPRAQRRRRRAGRRAVLVAPTPDSSAGRSPACGRRARSRPGRPRAYYYLTDVDPLVAGGAAGRAPARLQLPDALVHLDSRGVPGPLPALSAPAPGRVEGAQVDHVRAGVVRRRLGALLRADDDRGRLRPRAIRSIQLGQLAEALVRLARFIVGIRLHTEDLSVEQGVRFFRDEAFLEEAQRAPRGRARHVRSRPTSSTPPAS